MKDKMIDLQLFADGGEGTADATVETPADDGRARLLELGVPAAKIRKNRAKSAKSAPNTAEKEPQGTGPQKQDAAAEGSAPEENPEGKTKIEAEQPQQPQRMKWDEIVADPDYNKEIQKIVQERLKTAKSAQENLDKLSPALELLAGKYGLDGKNLDYDALSRAISDDDGYYEAKAMELGVDVETAKKLDRKEKTAERRTLEAEKTIQNMKFRTHIDSLKRQAEELKKIFPSFDLNAELQNPSFRRMTSPDVNIPVADAYYACHREEMQQAAMQVSAQKTAERLSASIQAGASRPTENGTSGQAPTVTTFDYRNASAQQREDLKRRIREAAARGEKVYPTGR